MKRQYSINEIETVNNKPRKCPSSKSNNCGKIHKKGKFRVVDK